MQIDGQLSDFSPHAGGVHQDQFVDHSGNAAQTLRRSSRQETRPSNYARSIFRVLQKRSDHLDEARDGVVNLRLVGAAKAEQIERDDAMRGAERLEAKSPLVGIAADAVNENQRRARAHIVVPDCMTEHGRAAQLRQRWKYNSEAG